MADDQEGGGEAQGASQPSEEELRAQLEKEIRKVKVEDVILQSVVSILNLAARRIAKDDERDLEQGKLGIDAAGSLVGLVPEEAQPQLRQAISELQLLYAKHAEGAEEPGDGDGDGGDAGSEKPVEEAEAQKQEGGAGQKGGGDSGLWTPPGA